ncbi:serine/threonine-protein kinase [Nocardioides litoris]|uniref:serine/threonine-protein kinase n=1 Tax=Nocardioides litoris TaxID=1926648 RepID=UPI001123D468|nr:serine/threonine-protein kinase [Nocardioides litoris]
MTTQPSGEIALPGATRPGPTRVGPYALLAKIGEGGMGVVHLARPDGGGPRVALKVMRPHIVGDDEARQRLAREVSSLRRIRSRWVAEIVDADPWAEVPYVATRYVPGLSLHDHVLHEGRIEGDDLTWFAACLAEGLASVHAAGVLHRDVKPSNVLMEGRTPILIDFGLARVADDPRLTHTGWLLGTPGYLAPEILYGDDASPASDLHSWAATVACAATGRAPFGRGPAMAIMDRVRRGEHDLTGLDGPLRDVVVAALAPEPADRPDLDRLLAWLRPLAGGLAPASVAPAVAVTDPTLAVPVAEDPFDAPLMLAAQAHDPRPRPVDEPLVDGPATLVLPAAAPEPRGPTAPPAAPTLRAAPPPPAPYREPAPAPWDPWAQPPLHLAPTPGPEPVGAGERVRRATTVVAGCLGVGAAVAAVPLVALGVVAALVWVLRAGSLAASVTERRRAVRGERWYDAPLRVLGTPWHLVSALPGALLLLGWAAGLAVAAALVCYALTTSVAVGLAVSGTVLALGLWWGPGGSRLRGPLDHLVAPVSHRVGPWLAVGVVLLVAAGLGASWAEASGSVWAPLSERPFAGR